MAERLDRVKRLEIQPIGRAGGIACEAEDAPDFKVLQQLVGGQYDRRLL
jgi:hypothetical protein